MRVVVCGLGAVGGTVAAGLAAAGLPVLGIARGAMLDALQRRPLTHLSPAGEVTVSVPCVGHPSEAGLTPDDVIFLTVKSQDTAAAMDGLLAAGLRDQPVFCAQNGIANEALATRYAANVHGVAVMLPATVLGPGRVCSFVGPRFGLFDIGCYPGGTDDADTALAAALEAGNFACEVTPEVMATKRGKLLVNLGNVIEAALGPDADRTAFSAMARAEAEAVYRAAGLDWQDMGADNPRRKAIQRAPVPGVSRSGGSTTQSLSRGAGQLETAWLNGEIVALARANGRDAPVNAALVRLGAHLAASGARPGSMSETGLRQWLGS